MKTAAKKTLKKTVGENVRQARVASGLTQEELAKKAGLSVAYVSLIERGQRLTPLDTLADLGAALSVPTIAFLS